MAECAACVVRRINKDALDLAREFLFERLQRQQVVAKDQAVVEEVAVGNPMPGVIRLGGVKSEVQRFWQ